MRYVSTIDMFVVNSILLANGRCDMFLTFIFKVVNSTLQFIYFYYVYVLIDRITYYSMDM